MAGGYCQTLDCHPGEGWEVNQGREALQEISDISLQVFCIPPDAAIKTTKWRWRNYQKYVRIYVNIIILNCYLLSQFKNENDENDSRNVKDFPWSQNNFLSKRPIKWMSE